MGTTCVVRGLPGVLAILCLAGPASAQVPDTSRVDPVYRIPDLTVRTSRPITTVGGSSAIEISLDSLRVRLGPAPTLEQTLRALPMIHVRTNSRGEAEVSVRGSESRQVAVLVDGIPLTLGWDGRTDVSVVPATAPQEISLIRGLSSVLYGPNVLGGVVEMGIGQSRLRPDRAKIEISAGFDQVGGYGTSGTFSQPFESGGGKWLMRGGVGFRDSPGQPLARGVSEPVATDDDLRLNTDAENVDGFLSLGYEADGGTWFSVAGTGYRAERGIAAELGTDDARFWRYPEVSRFVAVASGGTGDRATPLGRGDVEASLGIDVGRTEIESFTSRAYDELDGFENGDDRTLTLRLLADHTLGSRADLRTAFTYADIDHDADIDGDVATFEQRLWSVGAETIFRLVENGFGTFEALNFSVGGAIDGASTPQTGGREPLDALTDWGGRVGMTGVLAEGRLVLHAGASRRARFPSLRELYSESLNRFEPNPDLEPERLFAIEAGATTRIGDGELQAVLFNHRLTGAIRRITLEDGRRQRVNADRLRSTGIELLASHNWDRVTVAADMTLQSVDLVDPGNSASQEPENLPEFVFNAQARFPIAAGVNGMLGARHTGSQFCLDPDTGGDRELAAATKLNAGLSKVFSLRPGQAGLFSSVEASVMAENLGDVAQFDQCGLPQPGRLIGFQLRLF